jgi:uncharacterized membrane protein YdcZ (DUF606 family)
MQGTLVASVLAAVATGIAIGMQSTLSGRIGSLIGPVRTGLMMNIFGGLLAGGLVAMLTVAQGAHGWRMNRLAVIMLLAAGALGVMIITGVAFAIPRAGVTAGASAIILGQLLVSTIMDATGWSGAEPIPVDARRILGLAVMALAVFLLLPRRG